MSNLPTTLDLTSAEAISTIKQTVALNATDAELSMFISFCRSTGLNPFKKEVWFIKTKPYRKKDGTMTDPKVQMMTGINGFYTIANSHPQYDGMEEPTFELDGKNIISCTVKVWRKDRRFPSVGVARWDEYFPGKADYKPGIWETKPYTMIQKVAESIALRKAFPQELNGLYTQEEMPRDYALNPADAAQLNYKPAKQAEVLPHDPMPDWADMDRDRIEGISHGPQDEIAVGYAHVLAKPERGGNRDWITYKYRYHIPYKKEGKDMDAVRVSLKARGWKFNSEDKHWYTDEYAEKLAEYIRPFEDQKEHEGYQAIMVSKEDPGDIDLGPEFEGPNV